MAMDMAHKDHLLAAYHGLLAAACLLLCVLAEALVFALRRSFTFYLVPVSAMLLLGRYRRRAAGGAGVRVGLVDFSCLKPPRRLRLPVAGLLEHLELGGFFDRGSIEFMTKAIRSSGMGNETYLPPALHYLPPASTHAHAIREAHMLFFPALDDLFGKSSVPPSAVGALVVNCSGFCPAPSLAAIIANRYRMRADVKLFNLSGMGCSAGSIGVDVAAGLLRAHALSYAVVVSAEILTIGWYCGKDHGKLLLNCNFRTGCSAALLTNSTAVPVKYRLVNVTRTNTTANDRSYRAGYREEDEEGITGFTLGQGVGRMVSELLRAHLLTLSLSILPWREKARFAAALLLSMRRRRRDKLAGSSSGASAPMPDFRAAADHFCLPSSGKPMILRLGKGLGLGEREMEAALMTFHRFGNQSAASLWYQLAYLEAKGRVRKGDTVWHLGIGSGLKANSLVWERVAVADDLAAGGLDALGPWMECIHQYPVWE
ncbi:3-ketoacyl-CoA synthase 4-like [Triticum dicoccoides]|uniref:3-ketoacyl-CoA synthase 4-like n=1 Tax=Triticum dicoccoides TaxID=85692 RepID=UPI000E7A68CF|nr:3-ketoacyl-CoA synthase 4-like [Triticum dicoccoides]